MVDTPKADNGEDQSTGNLHGTGSVVPQAGNSTDSDNKEETPDEQRNYSQYVMRIFEAIGRAFVVSVEWLDENDGAVTAVATLFIAALTLAYVVYARAQWRAMDGQLGEIRKQYPELQKSANAATDAATSAKNQTEVTLKQLDLQREAYRLEKGGAKLRLAAFGIYHTSGDVISYGIRLRNDGGKEAMSIIMCRKLEFRKPMPDEKQCSYLPMQPEKREAAYKNRQTAVLNTSSSETVPFSTTDKNIAIYIWAFVSYTDWTGAELHERFCKQIPADEIAKIQKGDWGSENPLAFPDCE